MRERYHAQPRTHSFCAHAHEKQGCVMNHLRRKIVEQVNDQGMRGKGASTDKRDRKNKEAMGSSQECNRKRQMDNSSKW